MIKMNRNSIGLEEGHEIKEEMPLCQCEWMTLAVIPPIHRLIKKCDYCKENDPENEVKKNEKV